MIDENRFYKDGITYHAVKVELATCQGCAFRDYLNCSYPRLPPCSSFERHSGHNVVWVRDDKSDLRHEKK